MRNFLTAVVFLFFFQPRKSGSFAPRKFYLQRSSQLAATVLDNPVTAEMKIDMIDTRPHDHGTKQARKARRLNHAFRYLYRHDDDNDGDEKTRLEEMTSRDYLVECGGYTEQQIDNMHKKFPPLLGLDVTRHLKPKMRFLKETMLGMDSSARISLPEQVRKTLPPHYFGARLERIVAPRHAFLVHYNLPHGENLLLVGNKQESKSTRWHDFLKSCRNTKQFAALCNQWAREEGNACNQTITPKQIEAFDALFARGLMAAARDELCQWNNTWPLEYINITSGEMIELLIQHGANPLERDNRGVSLLHWAAGTGNLKGVQALFPYFDRAESSACFAEAERDGATPLHWAAAGANAREFGVGGSPEVCRYLLSRVRDPRARKKLVNTLTRDGNSALMWAAWSGTLETVKFLIRERADPSVANRNGCTVGHWSSSGGNLEVCKYMASTVGVDFRQPNHGGNTPLTHAVAFGRVEVVEWLRREIISKDDNEDTVAAALAWDFVDWTDGQDEGRKQVLDLFEDD
jgi:ankyrin repeat protein